MYVIKKMKLNKFQPRPIVTNRELFVAKGESPAVITSKDTFDCVGEPSVDGASKTKVLGLASDMAAAAVAKHESAGKSPDMTPTPAKDK